MSFLTILLINVIISFKIIAVLMVCLFDTLRLFGLIWKSNNIFQNTRNTQIKIKGSDFDNLMKKVFWNRLICDILFVWNRNILFCWNSWNCSTYEFLCDLSSIKLDLLLLGNKLAQVVNVSNQPYCCIKYIHYTNISYCKWVS